MNNKELIKNLQSGKTETVISALKLIASEGNNDLLTEVIKLFHQTTNNTIQQEIIKIIEHLKDPKSVPVIINAIENKDFADQLPVLVAACWKNGLNYEEYTETFVQVFIEGDFQLAFDAFTVIDNIEKIKKQDAERCLIKLRNAFDDINDDKKRLITELINIINDKKVNPGT